MKNKLLVSFGIMSFILLFVIIGWFIFSIIAEAKRGAEEAELSFSWLNRETASTALADGFMTDSFVQKMTKTCANSVLLSTLLITTPSGTVYAWSDKSSTLQYDINGKPQISNTAMFMRVFSTTLDIGDGKSGSVVLTAVLFILQPDFIFSLSRNAFIAVLTLILIAFILILFDFSAKKNSTDQASSFTQNRTEKQNKADLKTQNEEITPKEMHDDFDDSAVTLYEIPTDNLEGIDNEGKTSSLESDEKENASVIEAETKESPPSTPEGLFSPSTGIGWEQYLSDRLDAELIRAASSEQDLSLIIIQISGLHHTDLLSKKISKVLLETFKFRDLVFEFGVNGFAGILQNINLDQAMKIADELYAGIDSILMSLSYNGQTTIGITTRTARLIPASRMIEEALSASKKAVEEPSLPIVAFRANPDKYRTFVAENS